MSAQRDHIRQFIRSARLTLISALQRTEVSSASLGRWPRAFDGVDQSFDATDRKIEARFEDAKCYSGVVAEARQAHVPEPAPAEQLDGADV